MRARLPRGDWLWPAIWMLPVRQDYGPWPMSGEIDIIESRGNDPSYIFQYAFVLILEDISLTLRVEGVGTTSARR